MQSCFSADGMKDTCDNCPFVFDQTFKDVSISTSHTISIRHIDLQPNRRVTATVLGTPAIIVLVALILTAMGFVLAAISALDSMTPWMLTAMV